MNSPLSLRVLLTALALWGLAPSLSAQKSKEIGIMVGASRYNGDIHPEWLNFKFMKPAIGAFYRHNFNAHWAVKGSFWYGTVWATDAESKDSFQVNRNLSFKSSITEFSGQIEFNFYPFELGNSDYFMTPYVFTGLSLFKFNPRAEFGGEWYELQPLGTEGQGTTVYGGKEYSLTQLSIPIGGGIKMDFYRFGLGFEIGSRRAFTDYLDDVSTTYADKTVLMAENGPIAAALSDRSMNSLGNESLNRQRGNSRNKDWYTFLGVTLFFKIGKTRSMGCGNAFN